MLKKTESKIINQSPKRLRDKYPSIVAEYMNEVREDYDKIIKAFSLQKVLRPLPGDYIPPRYSFKFKRLGKTENYEQYCKNREKIKRILMLPHPFIRCIIDFSYTDFPAIFNDFSKYRPMGEKGIHDLRDFTKKDLAENTAFLKKHFYPKIVKVFRKYYISPTKFKLNFTKNQWRRAICCASGLICRQINELKIRTIEHLNEVILHNDKIPFLKIIAICDNQVDLCPTINEIYVMYHDFITSISEVGDNLDPLEVLIDEAKFTTNKSTLKVQLNDIILKDAHERIDISLRATYQPIETYLQDFQGIFIGLYSKETKEDLEEFLDETKLFEEYAQKIEDYKFYVEKLKRLVQKEYFNIAIISQSDAINSLRKISDRAITKISQKMISLHRQVILNNPFYSDISFY